MSSSENSLGPKVCQEEILGFGNSEMECPYKKVQIGKQKFSKIVETAKVSQEEKLIDELIKLLKSKEKYLPDPELEKRCPMTYDNLSSIFITAEEYGTRTHSVLLVTGTNRMTFVEETLMPDNTWKQQIFHEDMN